LSKQTNSTFALGRRNPVFDRLKEASVALHLIVVSLQPMIEIIG
jgi:hypothetical protein